MYKNKLNFWIDIIIFVDVLIVIFSGILIVWVLNKGIWLYTNFIFSKDLWILFYNWSVILLIIFVLIRLSLDFIGYRKTYKND